MKRSAHDKAVATALSWARFDWGRHAIDLVAWLAALRAFALFYRHGEEGFAVAERARDYPQ